MHTREAEARIIGRAIPIGSVVSALAVALILISFGGAAAAKRVALVMGNADYDHVSNLPNPANDAKDIAAALRRIGFEVTERKNLDFRGMRLALRDFSDAVADADAEIALVYFAGHGIEIDNTNYLIPVNAALRSDKDVELEAIRLDTLVKTVGSTDGLRVILVDACRNNPFLSDMIRTTATRSIGQGLARIDPGGVLVGYAARGGTLALDGRGRNSPYAEALLKHLEEPGLELGKMFRKVRDTVFDLTDGYQEPFTYGSLPGEDIFLVPAKIAPAAPAEDVQPVEGFKQQMFEDFEVAQSTATLAGWNEFIRKYGRLSSNEIVASAFEARERLVSRSGSAFRGPSAEPWLDVSYGPDREAILSREQRILVQRALGYMGHDAGALDGVFGPKTRAAIAAARLDAGILRGTKVDRALLRILPDVTLIDRLRSETARRYDTETLPPGLEPRLALAMLVFDGYEFVFDYYDGRLYLGVLRGNRRIAWRSAYELARRAGGYLATVADANENRFLSDLFRNDPRFVEYYAPADELNGPHFGLYQLPGSAEPRGGWTWVTGEPLTYRAWTNGHPGNWSGNSHFAQFNQSPVGGNRTVPLRRWADNSEWIATGFLVEID